PTFSISLAMPSLPLRSSLFPYTTLFRSGAALPVQVRFVRYPHRLPDDGPAHGRGRLLRRHRHVRSQHARGRAPRGAAGLGDPARDRKSTRLNSSHGSISYAVFCWTLKTG